MHIIQLALGTKYASGYANKHMQIVDLTVIIRLALILSANNQMVINQCLDDARVFHFVSLFCVTV